MDQSGRPNAGILPGMTLEPVDLVLIAVGLIATSLLPAVGWVVIAVVNQGRELAALREAVGNHSAVDEEIKNLLRHNNDRMEQVHGDFRQVLERSEWLTRTSDRHERFLESKLLEGGG